MYTLKRDSVIAAREEHLGQSSGGHRHPAKRPLSQATVVEYRPKATVRYSRRGAWIRLDLTHADAPKGSPTNSSQGAMHSIHTQTVPATSESQCEVATSDATTPGDELEASIHPSFDLEMTATEDCTPFKQAEPEAQPDQIAAIEYAPRRPVVEHVDTTAAIISRAMAPPAAAHVEPDTPGITFKQLEPDRWPPVTQARGGLFKQIASEAVSTREAWLLAAVTKLDEEVFSPANYPLPPAKVTVGFPSKKPLSKANRAIGQCWSRNTSADGVNQVFISPTLTSPVQFVDVLAHELVHAVDDCKNGHKHAFQTICKAIGLTKGRPSNASAGPDLLLTIEQICAELGPIPHAALSPGDNEKVQTTRLRKIKCPACGWTGRTTAKWAAAGLPTCHCGTELVPAWCGEFAIPVQPVDPKGGPTCETGQAVA